MLTVPFLQHLNRRQSLLRVQQRKVFESSSVSAPVAMSSPGASWATLHPVDATVRAEIPVLHLAGDIVFVGNGESLNDVNISEATHGSLARSVMFWHMELYPDRRWLEDVDWTDDCEKLHQGLQERHIARGRLTDGNKVWVSHFEEELGCSRLTRYVKCETATYFDLYHGDTIHLVPPRLTWKLSFTLRVDARNIRGWGGGETGLQDQKEENAEPKKVQRRRQRGRRCTVVYDTDTSSDE